MRRVLLTCLIGLGCAGPAAAAAGSGATPPPPPPPRTSLEGFVCERASSALDRVVSVIAVMRPVSATQSMQMRFVLQRRTSGSDSFTTVQGGDLGRWLIPKPSTLGEKPSDVWRLRKLVANLTGPATYRFRVTFRWLSSAEAVLGRTTMASAECAQP